MRWRGAWFSFGTAPAELSACRARCRSLRRVFCGSLLVFYVDLGTSGLARSRRVSLIMAIPAFDMTGFLADEQDSATDVCKAVFAPPASRGCAAMENKRECMSHLDSMC